MNDDKVDVREERANIERMESRVNAIENLEDAAIQERLDIVHWLRATANKYRVSNDLVGNGYAVTWDIIASLIENGEHHRE